MQKKLIYFFILLLFSVTSCRKESNLQNGIDRPTDELLQKHNSKIETWINLIPIGGRLTPETKTVPKTLFKDGNLCTRIEIGESGSSILFITSNNKFQVFGISTKQLTENKSGIVNIYDFQSLEKRGIRFSNGKIESLLLYKKEISFSAYRNAINTNHISYENITTSKDVVLGNASSSNIIKIVRKFFCELFGGTWQYAPYSIDSPTEYCSTGDGAEPVQELPPPNGGGDNSYLWLLLYPSLNHIDFFDFSSSIWASIFAGFNGGPINPSWTFNPISSYIDEECADPNTIRALLFTLNIMYNENPASLDAGSLDATFEEFRNYKDQQQVFIPIIPWLIKAGANGAADALMQALFIYLTEDDCPSFGAALGHDKFSKAQVIRSSAKGYFFGVHQEVG